MKIRLIKNKKEFEQFQNEIEERFFVNPDKFPCIAIVALKSISVDWKKDGFVMFEHNQLKLLYPDEIQKELYSEDFENIIK